VGPEIRRCNLGSGGAELASEQFAKRAPALAPTVSAWVRGIADLYAKPMGPTLYLLFGAVASLLIIGCANLSIPLLARGARRQHELQRCGPWRDPRTDRAAIAHRVAGIAVAGGLWAFVRLAGLANMAAWLPSGSFPRIGDRDECTGSALQSIWRPRRLF
jgi:hypothetical protein